MKKEEVVEETHQTTLKKIGVVLRQYRNEKKIGYIDAAEEIGLSKNTLYAMERGELNFQINTLFKVLDYYSVSSFDFFNDINKSDSNPKKNPSIKKSS